MKQRFSRRELLQKGALIGAVLIGRVFLVASRALTADIDPVTVKKFGSSLKGCLILPGDREYESARHVWDWSVDRHPAMIARCAEALDVRRSIEFAQTRELVVAVRSGGHGYWSTCNNGLVIDLSPMKRIDVDRNLAMARVEMGVRVAELDHATQRFGLAAAVGQCSGVGLGGLTLGGGEANLIAKYGMTCDNVRSADVVLADHRMIRADGLVNKDLLWGLCGGGGNFGAVTTFEFELHPVREVVAGTFGYPADEISNVLHSYRDFAASAPDELSATIQLDSTREGKHRLKIFWCWCGPPATGERILAQFRSRFKQVHDQVRRMTYLEAQAAGNYQYEPRTATYHQSRFIDDLSDEIIVALASDLPPKGSSWFMIHYHGEVTRRSGRNAFPLRKPGFNPVFLASWQGAERNESAVNWVDRMFAATARSNGGVYVNYLGDEGDARVRAAYGSSYHDLAQLKHKYDPTNFFCMNQNIRSSTK